MTVGRAVQFLEQLPDGYKFVTLLFQHRNSLVQGLHGGFVAFKVVQKVDGSGLGIGQDTFPVLSQIITRVTGITLYEYLKPRLLDPLGIKDVVWEMDLDGRNMGNGGMHSKTSDLAKFGIFLKNGGVWKGKQLLNREWVKAMTTPHIFQRPELSDEENEKDDSGKGYGYQTWMGRHNSYRAIGGQNQLIMVIPEYDLVVASNGQIGDEAGFNQLIYNLLDGMSDKKLKPHKNFDLQAAIGGYELKHPFPEASAQPGERSRTLRYRIHQNSYGLTGIAFRFDAEGNMYLTLETGEAIHNIPFGLDSWKMGSTDRTLLFGGTVYANSMNTTPMTTAGWCTWTGADVHHEADFLFRREQGHKVVHPLIQGEPGILERIVVVLAPDGQ